MWQKSKEDKRVLNKNIFSGVLMLTIVFIVLVVFFFLVVWGLMELNAYFEMRR